jgi:osmotically-inducible protein OsmY
MAEAIARSDREIQQAVFRELQSSGKVLETEVGVEVEGGVVTLTGTVESLEKKIAAERAAHRAPGVLDVADDIEVRHPRTRDPMDADIARAARQALRRVLAGRDEAIRTTVSLGHVWLTGTAMSADERLQASRAVRKLPAVRGVINQVRVADP